MEVTLLGVRGSRCAPGADFVQVGGNTSSVSITSGDPSVRPLLLDAGTGLTGLSAADPYRGDVLLTHLHWDHVQGLPFFAAGDRDGSQVRVLLPAQDGARPGRPGSAATLLAGGMQPPHFPIRPDELRGDWTFEAVDDGTVELPGFLVTAVEVPHKGGRTFGYRITDGDGATVAYLPDFCPRAGSAACLAVARGADLLLVGGMFAAAERDVAFAFGHATVDDAIELAARAAVGTAVVVHHAPTRTDPQVRALVEGVPSPGVRVEVGREGASYELTG